MNTIRSFIQSRCWLFLIAGLCLCETSLWADQELDDQFPSASGTADQEVIQHYEKQLQEIQCELGELNLPVPAELTLERDNIACLLDSPYFAQRLAGQTPFRFLVGRLVILNQSDELLVVETQKIRLLVGGKEYRMDDKQKTNTSVSFRKGNRSYNLTELEVSKKIEIPAGQVASSWVVFRGLDGGSDVPSLVLDWKMGNRRFALDATLQHRAMLRWRQEQIGPRGVIALGTIHGEVNTINMGTIVDELVMLATKNIIRIVISFDEKAAVVDPHLVQWLGRVASSAGQESRNTSNTEFPTVPAMIRKIKVINFPKKSSNSQSVPNAESVTHKNLNDAIIAISQSVYESIPVSELVEEIRSGDSLTKPAALVHGAARIPDSLLPEIIAMAAQDTKPLLKISALIALSDFNASVAVTALLEAARSKETSVSQTALVSLAASRFPIHLQALMGLLDSPAEMQQRVVRVLAQFPRKKWAETLYQHAQTGPVSLRIEAVKALNGIGHPRLQQMLISLLQDDEEALRKTSIEILSKQNDPISRKAVIDFALQQLENGDSDSQTFQVLTRYKVQQSTPSLITLLKTDQKQRSQIINTLAAIGSKTVLDAFIEVYPELTQSQERRAILKAMQRIDQHRFLEFAPTALETEDIQVVSDTCRLLRETATEQAVEIFIQKISQCEEKDPSLSLLISSLGGISTPRSREHLVELSVSGSEKKGPAARTALTNLYSRSPVRYLNSQANNSASSGNYELSIKQYTLIIENDALYPFAYQGRAIAYRAMGDNENYLADLIQLSEMDIGWPQVHGWIGQALTTLSRFEEAIESLNLAIQQKPDFANWYSSRGHAYSMLEEFAKAEVDYRKSLELDPKNTTALTGVALSMAINGKIDEAIALIKAAHAEHETNAIFAYNVACTYSRAAEHLQKKGASDPQQIKRVDQLIEKALDELDRAISLGYQDKKWTIADPDLAMLKEHQRFEKLLLKMDGTKPVKKPAPKS